MDSASDMELESEPEEISKTPGPGSSNSGSMQQTIDVQMEDGVPDPKPSCTVHTLDRRGKEEPAIVGSKPKAARKAKSRNPKHACQPGRPQWTFVPPTSASSADTVIPSVSPTLPPSRPRIWASRRSELLATLPELAGSSCIHGISWSLSPAPLILLEGQTAWGDVSADGLTMDISMAREFECCKSDIDQENPRPTEVNAEVPMTAPVPAGPGEGASKPKKPRLGYSSTPTRVSLRSSTLPAPAHRLNHTTWLINDDNTPLAPQPSFNFGSLLPVDELRNPAVQDNGGEQPQLTLVSGVIEPSASGADINIPPVSYGGHGPGIIPSAWLSSDPVEQSSNPAEYWRAPATSTDPMLCSEFDANLLMKMDCQPSSIEKVNITTGPCSNPNRSVSLCHFQETPTTQPYPVVPSMSHQEPSHPKRRRALSEICDATVTNTNPVQSNTPALDQDLRDGDKLEKKAPASIPPEIQTIIDTYIHGLPIVMIVNRNHLPPQWNMKLPEEYAYAYLGYFRVIRVWETIGEAAHPKPGPELDIISGRVDWRFRCRWISGGEDWAAREKKYLSPWWTVRSKATPVVLPDDVDSDQESSPHYRLCRTKSPNYPKRRTFFGQVYHPLIPLHLIAPYGTQTSDTVFPRGWYCGTCGKINYQIMLRHRDCSSTFCRTKPPSLGFALSLAAVRDPQNSHFIFSPDDTYPSSVTQSTTRWEDGSSTIAYTAPTANPALTIQHIFTYNNPILQEEPSEYFEAIQINTKLIRSSEDTSPYFSCSVGAKKSVDGVSYSWRSAPKCLSDVREYLHFRGQAYGEKDQTVCFVNSLQLLAWVTSGTKKGTNLLNARSRCVVILCLGSNTVLTVIPKSTLNKDEKQALVLDSLIAMDVDEVEDKELEGHFNGPSSTPGEPSSTPSAPPKKTAGKWTERPAISLSLVHGDSVVLHGDEFEYSIKRSGTGMRKLSPRFGFVLHQSSHDSPFRVLRLIAQSVRRFHGWALGDEWVAAANGWWL